MHRKQRMDHGSNRIKYFAANNVRALPCSSWMIADTLARCWFKL
jgi:hypothetical protein